MLNIKILLKILLIGYLVYEKILQNFNDFIALISEKHSCHDLVEDA